MEKLKLRTPQKNPAGQSYCGPTVLSAITGKPYNEVLSFIDSVIGKDSARELKWMKFDDLHACIVALGFKTEVEILDDDCSTENLCTLKDWIKGRDFIAEEMGDNPKNDIWILLLTKHFVIVQGDLFVDSQVGKPVPVSSAPGLTKKVRRAIKVF